MSTEASEKHNAGTPLESSLHSLSDALRDAPDRNDLGRLAQLHTWCQMLHSNDDPAITPDARKLAAVMSVLIEGIILNEVHDPDLGLALLPEAARVLRSGISGGQANADFAGSISRLRTCIRPVSEASPASNSATTGTAAVAAAPVTAAPPPAPVAAPAPPQPDGLRAGETLEALAARLGIEPYESTPLVVDMSEREHLQGFVDESREHMDAIEVALLEVERDLTDASKIDELFRPFHTIKGIAGFLNLRDINRLTHEVETILDMGRRGELRLTRDTINLVFAVIDVLKAQIEQLQKYIANPVGNQVTQPDITAIMAKLRLAACGKLPAGTVAKQSEDDDPGELPAASTELTAAGATAAVSTPGAVDAGRNAAIDPSIRVDTGKLDALVDAVGELVIAQTMVNLNEAVRGNEKLNRDVSQVTKIVRDIQATALSMRMVPIGQTFQKMRRLVRDVAQKAGKQVELVITGEETELDKTVIQQISDPLVHMVRNAVDHGVETPQQRAATGKPAVGQVSLHAFHQGDSIIIQICDDGRGLDRERILAKGVDRGLVQPDEKLSDQQIYQLIFQPGFSTAETITDISGRGVGMDVVKRNIDQLRGKIDISTKLGSGTTFSIRLPLTLAIIDGMLVRVGSERLIIPTIVIEQSLRPTRSAITTVQQRGEMIQVRGQLCPLMQLGQLFGYTDWIDPCEKLVVIAQAEGHKIGLVVDELIGQQQVVIKTLGERFKQVRGVSGAAILGDGRVGLILEPTGLLALYNTSSGGGGWRGGRSAEAVTDSPAETQWQPAEDELQPA